MKQWTVIFLAVVLLAVGTEATLAQPFDFGIKGGLNIANIGGEDAGDFESRTGLSIGGFIAYPLANMFYIQPELLYSMKGAAQKQTFGGVSYTGTLKLDYIEIPVLGKLVIPLQKSNMKPMVYAGPSLAFKLSSKLHLEGGDLDDTDDYEGIKSTDFGFVVGGGVGFPVGANTLAVEIRYDFGLSSIDDTEDNSNIKNNVIMLMVSYQI
jgi:hypothetical protein